MPHNLQQTLAAQLTFDANGLAPAIIQHAQTGQILMLGYMNAESLAITLQEGRACFWSRSRKKLWRKGETSGHFLKIIEARIDCDADAILFRCEPLGPTCHTGETSCFYRVMDEVGALAMAGDSQ